MKIVSYSFSLLCNSTTGFYVNLDAEKRYAVREVFEVDVVSPFDPNQWLVRGQARDVVKVGETVYCLRGRVYRTIITKEKAEGFLQNPGEVPRDAPFTVVAASTYGKPIDQLYRALTGDLVLEGANGAILQEGVFLVSLS